MYVVTILTAILVEAYMYCRLNCGGGIHRTTYHYFVLEAPEAAHI